LSANPRGAPVTAAELAADMRATVGLVNGFWLNVPAPGVGCPACHKPNPALMAQALVLFAAHPGLSTGRHPAGVAAGHSIRWYIAVSALRSLVAATGPSWVLTHLAPANTTVISQSAALPATMAPWRHHVVLDATSLAQFDRQVQAAQGGTGVLLDLEAWPLTPVPEQARAPVIYLAAERLAQLSHVPVVAAPAVDLGHVLIPGHRNRVGYLDSALIFDAAHGAQVFEIQAQGYEAAPAVYAAFVRTVAAKVRNVAPNIRIVAGLSTNPNGHAVTVRELEVDIAATRSLVDGYWLNIPQTGPACPHCGIAQVQIAVQLLASET